VRILEAPLWLNALLFRHVAAGVEHATLLRNLGKLHTLVDIGANRGQFVLVARYIYPGAIIHSFEPLPGPAMIFRQVFKNDKNVYLYESAIGDQSGKATIHISARDDSSSLLPITDNQILIFQVRGESYAKHPGRSASRIFENRRNRFTGTS